MSTNNKNILIGLVDEKSLTYDLDRIGYKKVGVIVKRFDNYKMLEQEIKKGTIDLVVLNLDYTTVDAFAILKQIKSSEFKDLPCMVTSVQSNAKIQKKSIAAGADMFVEKPLPRSFFIEKIKQLLEQKIRENNRLEIYGITKFKYENKDYKCEIADLSSTGVFIYLDSAIKDKSMLKISLNLQEENSSDKKIICEGEVVRAIFAKNATKEQIGIGIRFKDFKGENKRLLERFVAKLSHNDLEYAYYL